jgi:hypothetical protein
MDRVPTTHERKGGKLVESPNPEKIQWAVVGDGGLNASAQDYVRFLTMFLDEGRTPSGTRLLRKESVDAMTSNQIGDVVVGLQATLDPSWSLSFPIGAGRDKFGFGFQIGAANTGDPDLRTPGSYSWSGIFNTHFWVDPKRGIAASRLIDQPIEDELKESYLTYAMSVIVSRALPDVRDGLKPSQRRILVAMNDLNLGPTAGRVKCAKISGDTSGNYHPHGESVIYPTLVRMAQEWNMRHVLIDKQGNFGSVAGLPPAAMRYTEARLSPIAALMLDDLKLDTVDFVPTYDERNAEPTVLPSRFPNLLVNGTQGIAVGMATSVPPHNLSEICDALVKVIDEPEISIDELMEIVPGPDFPTGGMIQGRTGLRRGYLTGRSTIVLRSRPRPNSSK